MVPADSFALVDAFDFPNIALCPMSLQSQGVRPKGPMAYVCRQAAQQAKAKKHVNDAVKGTVPRRSM